MDILNNLFLGFQVALLPMNLLFCFTGVAIGMLVVCSGHRPCGSHGSSLPATFAVP
jgi:TctA family transporter